MLNNLVLSVFLLIFAPSTINIELMKKEIVQIRERKMPSGKTSLYLAYTINGKRQYEYPKLYLLPENGRGKTAAIAANKETRRIIEAMQAKKIVELTQNRSGIIVKKEPSKMLFSQYIKTFRDYKAKTTRGEEYIKTISNVERHIYEYAGEKVTMAAIDKKFCEGFISYLRTAKGKFTEQPLSGMTQKVYFAMFNTMLKKAVRDEIIPRNPIDLIDTGTKIKAPESERVYLDISELKKMAASEPKDKSTKQAFMFSCFTGLRISDIRQLKWEDIEEYTDEDGNSRYRMIKRMQKTQRIITYSLSKEAVSWLPERTGELVFDKLVCAPNLNTQIKKWAESCGITKNVSFHTARHTFATMMLTLGADIYTTSKLLGHSRISTTEIYAKIIDKKKDEAVGLIDKFFDKD